MTLLFLVPRKVASLFKCLATLVTAKPLFITVNKKVPFKLDFVSEHFLTEDAVVFSTLVFLKVTLLTEAPLTLLTSERLHIYMDQHVPLQA